MLEYMTLGEICTNIIDCPHETPKWQSHGVAVIRNFNLVNGTIDMQHGYYVDEETYIKRTRRAIPSEGDIIFSREAPIGNCAIIPANFKCCLGQRLVLLKVNHAICSSEYLLAVLQSPYVKWQIDQVSKRGSIVSNYAISDLRDLEIPVLSNQDSVAGLSSVFSSKIGNNESICSDLESMAKLLYDYWFVQFDFPDENGKPYKSSGGRMEWNEDLKRLIPAGWQISKLGKNCEILLGGTPDTEKSEYWGGNIPWLNSGEVANSPVLTSEKTITEMGKNNSATAFAKAGAVVMSITRYIRPSILGVDACFNQSVVAVNPSPSLHTAFVYPLMKSNIDRYMKLRTGAQQPHINKEIVEETAIVLPPEDVLNSYYSIAEKLYEQQLNVAEENRELAELRDSLLPMLMNGQVKV